jgi:hypothetical protein
VGPAAAPRSLRASCKGGRGSPGLRLPPARSLLRTAEQDASASPVPTPRRARPSRRPQVTFSALGGPKGSEGDSLPRRAGLGGPRCAALRPPTSASALGASLRAPAPGGDRALRPSPAIGAEPRVGTPCSERAGLGGKNTAAPGRGLCAGGVVRPRGCGCRCVRAPGGRGGSRSILAPRRGGPLLRNLPLPRVAGDLGPATGQPGCPGPGHLPAARPWDGSLRRAGTRPGLQSRALGRARLTWRPRDCGSPGGVGVGRLGTAGLRSLLVAAGAPRLLHPGVGGGLAFSGSLSNRALLFPFPLPPAPGAKFTASAMRWVWLPRRL